MALQYASSSVYEIVHLNKSKKRNKSSRTPRYHQSQPSIKVQIRLLVSRHNSPFHQVSQTSFSNNATIAPRQSEPLYHNAKYLKTLHGIVIISRNQSMAASERDSVDLGTGWISSKQDMTHATLSEAKISMPAFCNVLSHLLTWKYSGFLCQNR
ncbi:hypothetical protein CEXT_369491 [Caerostris extrusa]|uniref:Uncharacterized protein n=1 Tax=Caerostris extrusa TaxID=172846 RepID=A0AAV4SXL3_CAEEX|nr:hypothetical protein CEXT_369491 [Caerostris extrusa]